MSVYLADPRYAFFLHLLFHCGSVNDAEKLTCVAYVFVEVVVLSIVLVSRSFFFCFLLLLHFLFIFYFLRVCVSVYE